MSSNNNKAWPCDPAIVPSTPPPADSGWFRIPNLSSGLWERILSLSHGPGYLRPEFFAEQTTTGPATRPAHQSHVHFLPDTLTTTKHDYYDTNEPQAKGAFYFFSTDKPLAMNEFNKNQKCGFYVVERLKSIFISSFFPCLFSVGQLEQGLVFDILVLLFLIRFLVSYSSSYIRQHSCLRLKTTSSCYLLCAVRDFFWCISLIDYPRLHF